MLPWLLPPLPTNQSLVGTVVMESQEHHHSLEEVGELKDLRMPLQIHWCLLLHLQRQ